MTNPKCLGSSLPRHFQCKKCPFDGLENETNNSRRIAASAARTAFAERDRRIEHIETRLGMLLKFLGAGLPRGFLGHSDAA